AASVMAAPGALAVSKIIYPEVEESQTKNEVKVNVERTHVNLIDSIANAASDGMKVSLNVIAMLIALLSLIAMADWVLAKFGLFLYDVCNIHLSFIDLSNLSIKSLLGAIFSFFALIMGVPIENVSQVGALMGEKLVLNEFIAYTDLINMKDILTPKAITIASFALCGFANFGSIAIQIGGIGELAPTRRGDIAKLGIKALIAGTFASYISASMAGILM
ncbi:TPA: NupC/NupG family nucleoside CNT transporter, partial [Candidatus Galligastranaerophilus intestinigallinarum]|nr:NupC/NupG family nucleoside CNT transporter [Candidatus Galligastranaerophilus intestinigallinarum]